MAQENRSIAVIALKACEGISQGEADILTSRLNAELISTNAFSVMEREQIENIFNEIGLQQSGCTTDECIVEIGQLLAVQEIMTGSVGKFGTVYTVSLKIVDVKTGKIIDSKTDDINGDMSKLLTESMKKLARKFAGIMDEEGEFPENSDGKTDTSIIQIETVSGSNLFSKDQTNPFMKVEPNPIKYKVVRINVYLPQITNANLSIYSTKGEKVIDESEIYFTTGSHIININISNNLESGLYIVKLVSEEIDLISRFTTLN